MLFSIFLYALDGTIVAVIQATIVNEFDALSDLAWNNVGFLMGATATVMFWGQVYTQFNSKLLHLFNVVVFKSNSAVCAAAPNMEALIVGRCICGISGAGLCVGVFAFIAATTTMAERRLYVSGTGLTWGLGTRWAFYINLFIGAACAPAWLFLLPNKDPRPGVAFKDRVKELDYAGIMLLVGSLVSLIMAINFGGVAYTWGSGQIIGLFVCACLLFILLAIQQSWSLFVSLPCRLIPFQYFRRYTVIILFVYTSASATGVFVPIFFVPLLFQFTRDDEALDAGVHMLPLIIILVITITINGTLMAKFGYYMPWYLVDGLVCAAGGALMHIVQQDTSRGRVYGYTVVIGVGVGMWIQASFSVAQAILDPENVPAAVGSITLAQFLGNTTALAIANAVFLNEAETRVQRLLPSLSPSEIQAAISGVTVDLAQRLSADTRTQVLDAIVASMGKTYILVMTSGALVATLSLALKREKLFITPAAAGV